MNRKLLFLCDMIFFVMFVYFMFYVCLFSDLPDFDEVDVTSTPRGQNASSNFVRRNAWTRTSLRRSPAAP